MTSAVIAHHNPVDFILSKDITLSGNVSRIERVNPHVYIYLDVLNEIGETEQWPIESQSPIVMTRYGWTRNTLKVGESVAVLANPARDRSRNAALGRRVIREDGIKLPIVWDPDRLRETIRQ